MAFAALGRIASAIVLLEFKLQCFDALFQLIDAIIQLALCILGLCVSLLPESYTVEIFVIVSADWAGRIVLGLFDV